MYGFATMLKKMFLGTLFLAAFLCGIGANTTALAVDLPLAAGSPIAGISFDDQPLMLPVQRNFQMAMLLASSEMGRSCGKMEAYGWRLGDNEQNRVNLIFNNTVDRLRALGFTVESQKSDSVSSDVTLYTADRSDKHMISLWSAGEIGLVMVLCETSAPLSPIPQKTAMQNAERMPTSSHLTALAPSQSVVEALTHLSEREAGMEVPTTQTTRTGKPVFEKFTPVGQWVGTYACAQGTTGATFEMTELKGDQFKGVFKFYPTPKNEYISKGSYKVFGEYDADSQRILINPGEWIERPENYYNTIMIGSFDPVAGTFSGYFQGIAGCTSLEAHYEKSVEAKTSKKASEKKEAKKKAKKITAKKNKKKIVVKKIEPTKELEIDGSPTFEPTSLLDSAPEPAVMPDPLSGISIDGMGGK